MKKNTDHVSAGEVRAWIAKVLPKLEAITRSDLLEMFHGNIAGLRIPGVFHPRQCERVVKRIVKESERLGRAYHGNLNIGSALDIDSHWEFMYQGREEEIFEYFRKVPVATKRRRKLFQGLPDPMDLILRALAAAWGAPVRRAKHPRYGWRMFAGIIRSGAPKLHFDWASYDLQLTDAVMQAGVNLYLSNSSEGGDLKIYRTYGMHPGHKQSSGQKVVGNYELPRDLVRNADACTIRCGVGDVIIAPNRFLHEVTEGNRPEGTRLVLSFHLCLLSDGSLVVFS